VTEVVFPLVDDSAPDAEGVVSTWFVENGAHVVAGALLAEVQVTKIADEITAPAEGTLRHKVAEGDLVAQGAVVAVIE
jgi:pyruvate/2-oxoglutarate dehydrogenase complex dihydrolipoamide acyltransferase (E2) component